MKNIDVAHMFFYEDLRFFNRSGMTVSYTYNKFYSYSTCIGELAETVQGTRVLLVSANIFSHTTAKHLHYLQSACPLPIVTLPQRYENTEFDADYVVKQIKQNLEFYAQKPLTQKANRQGFIGAYQQLQALKSLQKFKGYGKEIHNLSFAYSSLFTSLSKELQTFIQQERQKERNKRQKLKNELKLILQKHPLIDIIKMAYAWNSKTIYKLVISDSKLYSKSTYEALRDKIKKYLNPKNKFAYIWATDNTIYTSKCIELPVDEVKPLLKLWKHNKLKHGMRIRNYVVLAVTSTYVQVGCHKIPTSNLEALYKELEEVQNVA